MSYALRKADAERLHATPPRDDQPGQKFPRGAMVKVDDELPAYMSHFEKGFIGVVEYTYAQKYGGGNAESYSLLVLNDEKKPTNSIAWYEERHLALIGTDTEAGEKLIEQFHFTGA